MRGGDARRRRSSVSDWIDDLVGGGAFRTPARRFVTRFMDGSLPLGVEGLIALCAAIDGFAADGDPADDDAFLEGAGALLSVIVIAAHPGRARHIERAGVHRLMLGEHGCCDPFASISRALEGEVRARKCLTAELGRCESEIMGFGAMARMSRAFEEALAERRPELMVVHRFESERVLSDETTVDLRKAIEATADIERNSEIPAAVLQAARKLVDMLPGGVAAISADDALAKVCPRLIAPEFAREAALHSVPFRGELRIALVLRMGERARFVLASDLPRWSLDPDALLLRALDNLALASSTAVVHREPPLFYLRSGDGLDSARLLLPGLHETIAPELGETFLAAVPHRDVLLLARTDDGAALRARTEDDHARAPHRVSSALFRVSAGGIATI
jgi:hypothetical protein